MNEILERTIKFLDDASIYYLATVEEDQPRVRPFGTALVHNDKLYIQTGKVKKDSYLIYALNEYLSDTKVVDGAFYIDGPWGSGKSYFIDRYIKIYTEQHKKVNPDFDENKDKLFIKVSLNGVKNIDDVSKEIFAQCHPTISKIFGWTIKCR